MDVAADVLVTVRGRLEDDGELSVNVSGCKHTQAFPDSLAADSLLKETNLYVVCVWGMLQKCLNALNINQFKFFILTFTHFIKHQ